MSDIFREVDEALQQEKLAKIWKAYGPVLVLAGATLILATAGFSAYRHWDGSADRRETGELITAAESDNAAAALEKAAADTRDGHKAVALMNAAGKEADDKQFAKAAALYDEVAKDGGAPSELRDLAAILHVRAALLGAGDTAPDYKVLAERLLPIARNDKSPFRMQAKLEAASLYGDGLKDYKQALSLLDGFDDSTADSLKEKASALKNVYQYELSKAAPAAAAQPDTAKP